MKRHILKQTNQEKGITLVALIITIIILIILAAVAIRAAYDNQLVEYATNGTQNYMEAGKTENAIFENTTSYVDSVLAGLASGNAGGNGSTNSSNNEESTSESESSEETSSEESSSEEEDTGIDFGGMTEEEKNNMIGKYVDYTPTAGTFAENTLDTYSGSTANGAIATETSLNWRILEIDDTTLTLISDVPTTGTVTFSSYTGYNNAVLLLNNICKTNYSNSSLGATGRSMKIEDIEDVASGYTPATQVEYTPTNKYYPTIFASEEGGNINNEGYGTLGRSEQENYVTQSGAQQATTLKAKQTYYTYTMTNEYMDDSYVELFRYKPGTETNLSNYWLASRRVTVNTAIANFNLSNVRSGEVSGYYLYLTSHTTDSPACAIRPVVSIPLSSRIIGETGIGSTDSPYSIK